MSSKHRISIEIYGKKGCLRCTKAKEHITKMGFKYIYHDAIYHSTLHKGWRIDNSVEFLAAIQMDPSLPQIKIDGIFYPYSAAMKELKGRIKNGN